MGAPKTPSSEPLTSPKRAKSRLRNIVASGVALVDRPANRRPFLITKADDMPETEQKKSEGAGAPADGGATPPAGSDAAPAGGEQAVTEKGVPAMGTEAKQNLLDGLADTMEKLVAVTNAISEAPVAEGAGAPQPVLMALDECAKGLAQLAQNLAPAATPAEGGAPPPPQEQQEQKAAPPPMPPGKTEDEEEEPPVTKAEAEVLKSTAQLVEKRASKLGAKERGAMKAAWDLISTLLAGHAEDAPPPAGDATPAPPAPAAPVAQEKAADTAAIVETVTKSVTTALRAELTAVSAQLAATNARHVTKSMPAPNGQPEEGGPPPEKSVVWPNDMSADLEAKRLGR